MLPVGFLKTLHHKLEQLNCLTDWQIIGADNNSRHRLTRGDSCVGISRNGFQIVGNQHPLYDCGFLQERWVLQTLHNRFLNDDSIQ